MTDMRFMRLASVGLMVRAPKPVTWPGMTDIRFDPAGVVVRPGVPLLFPGVVWPTIDSAFCGSGVREGVNKSLEECRLGSRIDFVLSARGDFESSLPSGS